jgi:hypothetical protein
MVWALDGPAAASKSGPIANAKSLAAVMNLQFGAIGHPTNRNSSQAGFRSQLSLVTGGVLRSRHELPQANESALRDRVEFCAKAK